jgi:hypothetical protein
MFSSLISVFFRKRTQGQAIVFLLSGFVFCSFALLGRGVIIDEFSDIGNYFVFWGSLNSSSLLEAMVRFEPGFVLIAEFCSLFLSFPIFLWLVQFIVFYAFFLLASVYTGRILVSLLLAVACLLFYLPFTELARLVIRQGLAAAVFFCFLARYHDGRVRWLTAMPWMVAMILLHYSSVFVVVGLLLVRIFSGLRAFYFWCIAMALYCLDLSGQFGLFLYGGLDLNIGTLNAVSSGGDYTVGFKVNFLLLNAFYVALPVILAMLGVARIPIRRFFSHGIFRLYFVLNGLATIFSLMPFYDRFFMWSWALGPVIVLAVTPPSGRKNPCISETPVWLA